MRHAVRNALLWCSVGAFMPLTLPGQTAPDRRFLDSVIAQAHAATTASAVPLLSRCVGRDPDVVRICQAIIATYHGPLAKVREEVIAADEIATESVFQRDRWPHAWFALGIVRLQLARDKVLAHEGPALPAGMSNELGGANALIHALALDPTFAAAANALALAAEPREGVDALAVRVTALRRARSLLSPSANVAAAIIERDAGSADSAAMLERRALASGAVDSGSVLLAMARDQYRANHPAAGRAALIQGADASTTAGRTAYRTELAWVATPRELEQWDSVTPRDRPAWLAGFWSRRDVAEGRPDGSRLIEHYNRVEYAIAHFRIAAPETNKQNHLMFMQSNEYFPERLGLKFASQHADLCPGSARLAADATLYGADAPERTFRPAQDQFDDRGTIWIRHGAPTRRSESNSDEAVEVWRYARAERPLVVQFRAAAFAGTTGVSVLIPSLLTMPPGLRNQVCAAEPTICARLGVSGPIQPGDTNLVRSPTEVGGWGARIPPFDPVTHRTTRIPAGANSRKQFAQLAERCRDPIARVLEREVHEEGTLLGTAAIMKARDSGRVQIEIATTTDSYHRDFARSINPATQLVGLDRATGGAPRLVVGFALPAEDVGYVKADSERRVTYPVRVQVMAGNVNGGPRIDVDTVISIATDGPLHRGQSVAGILDVPLPGGTYVVGLVFTQSDGRGVTVTARDVAVPSTAGRLAVSDMVLGRESSGVRWNSGATNVLFNPTSTYAKGSSAEIYFQLSGLNTGSNYQTKFDFFRADDDAKHGPRLTVSFAQAASQDRIEVARTLGLAQLDPGKYRVKLTVTSGGAETAATGWLTIIK